MRAADIRRLENLFGNLTGLRRFMVDAEATRSNGASCGCVLVAGRYQLANQCKPTRPGQVPPEHCRSVTHVTVRAVLHQMHLPCEHLTDPELEQALAQLAALVDRAPQLTEEEFVVQMQQILRVTEEIPTP